jgi:predicted enzyme related to lactoylglutathione lyase
VVPLKVKNPPEVPGSIPYCEVRDIRSAFSKAISSGASEMMPPSEIPGGFGWIAIVNAPGGVAIGLWAQK